MGSVRVQFPLAFLHALMEVPLNNNLALQNAKLEETGPCLFVAWKTEESVCLLIGGRENPLDLEPSEEGLKFLVTAMQDGDEMEAKEEEEDEERKEDSPSDETQELIAIELKEQDEPEAEAVEPMEYDASEFKESTSGGRMKYRCPDNKCTERFMQLNDVMYHIQNHSEHLQDELLPFFIHAVGQVEANDDDVKGKSIISCPLCQRACIRIRRHLNTAHKDDPFYQQALECCDYIQVTRRANKARQAQVEAKCDFCHKGFGCVDRMRLHSRYHCPKTPDFHKLRTCSQCAFQTTYRAKFVQHVASCHVGTVLCLHCEEIFADVESMNEHMQNQHSWLELLPCHLCEAITLSEENFDSHMMSHQPENEDYCPLISCQFCSKCYPTPHACWRHAWFSCPHNPQRRAMLSCNQCNFATSSEQLYADHMITEHNSEPGIFHCELCNRYYKSEHALKTHNHITHSDLTELKHHVCRLCREHFGTTKELDEHNQTHAEAGYYQCEICSTNCKHLSGLRSHILYRHKGKFPQTCPQCTSGIANKKCMEFHLCANRLRNVCNANPEQLTLMAQRQAVCDICNITFRDKTSMRQHRKRMHFNKYPHHCPKCGHGMRSRRAVSKHCCGKVVRSRSSRNTLTIQFETSEVE